MRAQVVGEFIPLGVDSSLTRRGRPLPPSFSEGSPRLATATRLLPESGPQGSVRDRSPSPPQTVFGRTTERAAGMAGNRCRIPGGAQVSGSDSSTLRNLAVGGLIYGRRMGDEPTKRCNRCQTIRPLTEWGRDRSRADGLAPRCKLCNREKALVQRSNPERQAYMRDYQRQWCAARRAEWFADKTCVDCGSVDALEIDHVDPAQKVSSHIWSWAEERRVVELEKCVVRCNPCHARKPPSIAIPGSSRAS